MQMQVYIVNGQAKHKLDKHYALFVPNADYLYIDSPLNIVHECEMILDGEHCDIVSQRCVIYTVRDMIPNYDDDVFDSDIDDWSLLRDQFVEMDVSAEDGTLMYTTQTDTFSVMVDGVWLPVQ